LQEDPVALRRTLIAVVGMKDKDYLKLRVERAGYPDDDDDANAPAPPKAMLPAAPGVGPQPAG
jgi:hypothetical protein